MPGKSRHGKGKHYHSTKKSKAMRRQGTAAAPQTTANMTEVPKQAASAQNLPGPRAAVSSARAAENTYPYITSELRRIAILAGIIIVILVVLSIILT